jgi:hypothetical protein
MLHSKREAGKNEQEAEARNQLQCSSRPDLYVCQIVFATIERTAGPSGREDR